VATVGYKSGREIHCYKKKSPVKNNECRIRFSNYYIAKTIKKKVTACVFKMSCLVPWNMCWCERQEAIHLWYTPLIRTVLTSGQNCTYGGTFSIYCMEFSNSFLKLQIKHFHKKTKSDIFIKLHTICFSTVCYTVKHVLSEMIEIVPPNHIWYLRFLTPEYVSWVLIFLTAYFPPHFSLAGVFWRYEHIRSGLDIVRCPVIEIISFSTAHQSRFSLSPVLRTVPSILRRVDFVQHETTDNAQNISTSGAGEAFHEDKRPTELGVEHSPPPNRCLRMRGASHSSPPPQDFSRQECNACCCIKYNLLFLYILRPWMMKHSIESHIWTPRHESKRIMSRQVWRNCHYKNVSLISF
jgi:hypothetical protein